MKSYRNKVRQEIMEMQDVIIKQINLKNQQITLKEVYLVLEADQNLWVGSVQSIPFGNTTLFQQFSTLPICIKSASQALISVWDYESVSKIHQLQLLPTNFVHNSKTFKFKSPNIQIQINLETISWNCTHQHNPRQSFKSPRFSLPSLKQNQPHRNSLKLQGQSINLYSAVQYPSVQLSHNTFIYLEDSSKNDTSLEMFFTQDKKAAACHLKGHGITIQEVPIKLQTKKNYVKSAGRKNNMFDDYQTRPKYMSKRNPFESEKVKQAYKEQKIVDKFNSPTSCSTIKKNLQNMISKLTKKPTQAQSSQTSSFHMAIQTNNSGQFFDYGLAQSQKTQQNIQINNKNKNNQPRHKLSKLQTFYEKHLTKKQIQKVAKLTSFELSKSIFQQYGLDLSLTKIYSSKSLEKRKLQEPEKPPNKYTKKHKNSADSKKGQKKLREVGKNKKNNNENKFEDYGECVFGNKSKSFKSLRRMERPKCLQREV